MSATSPKQAHDDAIQSIDVSIALMTTELRLLVDQFKYSLDRVCENPELGIGSICGTTYPNIVQLASRIGELKDRREYHKMRIIEVTYVPTTGDDGRPWHKVVVQP